MCSPRPLHTHIHVAPVYDNPVQSVWNVMYLDELFLRVAISNTRCQIKQACCCKVCTALVYIKNPHQEVSKPYLVHWTHIQVFNLPFMCFEVILLLQGWKL